MLVSIATLSYCSANYDPAHRPDVAEFIEQTVQQTNFTKEQLTGIFKSIEKDDSVLAKIKKPYEDISWQKYQSLFLKPTRIEQGKVFQAKYAEDLRKAQVVSKIPAPIITAIIGVESNYGTVKYPYQSLVALSTLAFDYPKRSKFFTSELHALFKLAEMTKREPSYYMGSYAGAIGIPQFMPSSYLDYSKSANRHYPDLVHSYPDSISSIANYLIKKGKWQPGEKYVTKVDRQKINVTQDANELFIRVEPSEQSSYLKFTATKTMGVWCADDSKCWLLHNNFFSILSYNKSPKYAMVIIELAKKFS